MAPGNSSEGTPTGTVVFVADGFAIGTGTLNSSGVATFTDSSLGFGLHSIQAVYSGDTTFATSTSTAIPEYITSAGTQPNLTVEAVRNSQGKIVGAELVARISVTAPGTGRRRVWSSSSSMAWRFIPGGGRRQRHGHSHAARAEGAE